MMDRQGLAQGLATGVMPAWTSASHGPAFKLMKDASLGKTDSRIVNVALSQSGPVIARRSFQCR